MYRDSLNFDHLLLLHLLVYQAEACRETLKWGYLHCVKILSGKSLIQIFDDTVANQEYSRLVAGLQQLIVCGE